MISVLISTDADFKNYENQLKLLYEKCKDRICDSNTFEFIRDNTLFYAFLDDNKLLGAIYYFMEKGKLFLNGFAQRKNFLANLECLKRTLDWFKSDIYAEAQNRASALCLLRCGFSREKENLFVYRH